MSAPTTADLIAGLHATRDRDESTRWARLLSSEADR